MMRMFNHYKDMSTLSLWLELRNEPPLKLELPKIGFIVDDIAAGFLCQTDSGWCFIDPFFSNPKAKVKDIRLAMVEIGNVLLDTARQMKFKRVLYITSKDSISKFAYRNGMQTGKINYGYIDL